MNHENYHKNDCLICGGKLIYKEDYEMMTCYICGKTYDSNVECINGHYVCDTCHSLPANDFIERYCIKDESVDPLNLAISLMDRPFIKMHGPEHHFLVPAVLLTSYYNIKKDADRKMNKIKIARKRAEKVSGGFCGYYGDCGSAVGTGIFISLITDATPLSRIEWRLSNLMTAKSLYSIANAGGPRCCKRSTYLAIIEAADFLKKYFDVFIPLNRDINCHFSPLNRECLKEDCIFNSTYDKNKTIEKI